MRPNAERHVNDSQLINRTACSGHPDCPADPAAYQVMDATNTTLVGKDQGWCTRTVAPTPPRPAVPSTCSLKPGASPAFKPLCEAAKAEPACVNLNLTCAWGPPGGVPINPGAYECHWALTLFSSSGGKKTGEMKREFPWSVVYNRLPWGEKEREFTKTGSRQTMGNGHLFAVFAVVPDQLMVEGPFYDQAEADGSVGTLAITGGTGRYTGARGWMGLYDRNAPTQEYDFVYCINHK